MKIVDDKTLDVARRRERCEWCRSFCTPQPHHVFTRGAGQLDVPFNIVALCFVCHDRHHYSSLTGKGRKADKAAFLEKIAERDGWSSGEAVEVAIMGLKRAAK